MPRLTLTQHLERFVSWTPREVPGQTVREVFSTAFVDCPALRSYLEDEQGHLRKHVKVFIDGEEVSDRQNLCDRVGPGQEIFVMQALSGG